LAAPARPADQFVQSLARGLEVIRAFDSDHPAMTLSQMAGRTGMTRASARRFLLTLENLGYVRADGRQFRLTPRVLDLGYAFLAALDISDLVLPHMEHLVKRVDESSSLSVLDGDEIVYVLRVPVRKVMTVRLAVGARLPAFASSMGRVLLADLPEAEQRKRLSRRPLKPFTPFGIYKIPALLKELRRVRTQGYALVQQELELGLCSLAVPIRHSQRVVAALNVGMRWHATRERDALDNVLPALRETAAAIEEATRHMPALF
jgi:IclR family transcriptional regulator, pca regulon regulatory protein